MQIERYLSQIQSLTTDLELERGRNSRELDSVRRISDSYRVKALYSDEQVATLQASLTIQSETAAKQMAQLDEDFQLEVQSMEQKHSQMTMVQNSSS